MPVSALSQSKHSTKSSGKAACPLFNSETLYLPNSLIPIKVWGVMLPCTPGHTYGVELHLRRCKTDYLKVTFPRTNICPESLKGCPVQKGWRMNQGYEARFHRSYYPCLDCCSRSQAAYGAKLVREANMPAIISAGKLYMAIAPHRNSYRRVASGSTLTTI